MCLPSLRPPRRSTKGQPDLLLRAVVRAAAPRWHRSEPATEPVPASWIPDAQSDARGGFILDGFPRTITQGLALDKILDGAGLSLDRVLELKVDAAMLLDRILKRAADAKASGLTQRADDNEDALRVRLDLYRKQTEPLSDYYSSKGILRSVDGLQTIEAVSNVLWEVICA